MKQSKVLKYSFTTKILFLGSGKYPNTGSPEQTRENHSCKSDIDPPADASSAYHN